jgi:ferredoxin
MMVTYNKAYMVPNPMTPNENVIFDEALCTGCNVCVDSCRSDVLVPNPQAGKPPIVLYPDECWFCGCCVGDCPVPGASRLEHPLNLRNNWKRKDTGQTFRLGMKNPPPPNTRPAVG